MKLKEKQGVLSVRLALSVLAGFTLLTGAAQAQTATSNDKSSEPTKVVITGSNIARIAGEGPTPVEIVSRVQIDRSGASTVVELLSKLPSIGVQLDGNSKNSFAGGAASVGLRGLDPKYTLILLNGRRLANYGFADGAENSFVDLNTLPLAALESVEILRDGASAIYGSDAVAGVINFRTRTNYQGLEVAGRLGENIKGDGSTGNISATKGWGDIDADGYNVLLSVDALKRNSLRSSKHSALALPDYRKYGGTNNLATTSFQGWVRDYDNGEPGYAIPGCKGQVGKADTGDQVCFTNPERILTPSIQRFGVSTIITKRLGGGDELFAELGLNRNKSSYQQGYPRFSSQFLVPTKGSTNPGVLGLPGETDTTNGFTPGDRLQIFHDITEVGHGVEAITNTTARVVGGWRGKVQGWDSEFAVNLNQSKLVDDTTNRVLKDVSNDLLAKGVLGTPGGYDPFNPANPISLVQSMMHTMHHTATSRLGTAEWKMSTPELFKLQDRAVGFAWGAQASHESINDVPDDQTLAGNIVDYGTTGSVASRNLYSVYGELAVPLLANLDAQVAARADHYSDFGNSYNPKVALAWRPTETILVRGSATTSFKAPTLPEIGATTTAYASVADWARCGPLGYVGAQCSYGPKQYLKGNPNLKPEKAKNYSVGIVLQPLKELVMSLDWYGINQRDTIQALDPQYVLDHEDSIPGFAALIGRDPRNPALEATHPGLNKGRINNITTPYSNVGKTKISGFDMNLKYDLSLGAYGKLRFNEVVNRTLKYDQSITPNDAPVSRLDSVYHPRWSNSFTTAYEQGTSQFSATARTYASTLNIDDPTHTQDAAVTNARIPSYTVWDLNYSTKVNPKLTVNVGINNAFDKAMVYANTANVNTYVQSLNDVVGRYVYVNARYAF